MDVMLPAVGVAVAAFCLWLAVRIVNRRERWAKWTAAGLSTVLAYPISFGPACWISSRLNAGAGVLAVAYRPLVWVIASDWRAAYNGERETPGLIQIGHALEQYAELGAAQDWTWHPNLQGIDWRYDWIWSREPRFYFYRFLPTSWADNTMTTADTWARPAAGTKGFGLERRPDQDIIGGWTTANTRL